MGDELKQTCMEQAQPAETPAEASMADERLHTLPSEIGGSGMGPPPPPPRPPRVGGAPNPGDDDPDDDERFTEQLGPE